MEASFYTAWFNFSRLIMFHSICIALTTVRLDCKVDTGIAHRQITPGLTDTRPSWDLISGVSRKAWTNAVSHFISMCPVMYALL